jgi:hypothetical protein
MSDTAPQQQARFKNRVAVLEFLKGRGYKIGKSKLYQDADSGALPVQQDGSVLEADVYSYIVRVGLRIDDRQERQHRVESTKQRDAEARLAAIRAEKEEFALDREKGKYLLKEDVFRELAGRAAIMDANLRHFVQSVMPDLIAAAKGDVEQSRECVELFNNALDRFSTEFANSKTFTVLFETDEEADHD